MIYIELAALLVTAVIQVFRVGFLTGYLKKAEMGNCFGAFRMPLGWPVGLLFAPVSALLIYICNVPGFYIQLADLFIALIVISVIDIKDKIVPDCLTVSIIISQLAAVFTYAGTYVSLWNLIITVAVLLILMLASKLSKEEIGMGDVKLIAAVNLFFGLPFTFYSMLFGMFAVLIVSVPLMFAKKMNLKSQLPFIPFYTVGVAVYTMLNVL